MKPSLWFVVPAHGRHRLTGICLRQLRRTCDELTTAGIDATAVIIAEDANLETARALGFATVDRENTWLARKFNDGIQLACDRNHNPRPADFVVPCGSDDWVDHRLFLQLPAADEMVGFPQLAVVREDGLEISTRHVPYPGGSGIRIYPRAMLEPLSYRPADEDRKSGCDTSILYNLQLHYDGTSTPVKVMHSYVHDYQVVDWKSPVEQMNAYEDLQRFQAKDITDPFEVLADYYPQEALEEMQAHYERQREMVAA